MSEIGQAMQMLSRKFSTAVQQIRPAYPGCKNPNIGKFIFVGSIPAYCYDFERNNGRGGSKVYDSEKAAIMAAIAGGADVIQGADCRKISIVEFVGSLSQAEAIEMANMRLEAEAASA